MMLFVLAAVAAVAVARPGETHERPALKGEIDEIVTLVLVVVLFRSSC